MGWITPLHRGPIICQMIGRGTRPIEDKALPPPEILITWAHVTRRVSNLRLSQTQTSTMRKGKKRAANVGPKPKRRRVSRSEQEVGGRSLTDLPVELCIKVRTVQVDWRTPPERTLSGSDILQLGGSGSPSRLKSE